jgi:hypothetical protein
MLSERLPWMYRAHENHNPNEIAAITQAKVATALIEAGKVVLVPWMQIARYDLVMEEGGKFSRVQCKTGQFFRGAVYFRPQSLRAAKRETGWQRVAAGYQGEIEYFGVYCPDNGKVYLVPIGDVDVRGTCFLRIDPPKNNQQKRIRWARDYELKPLPDTSAKGEMNELGP